MSRSRGCRKPIGEEEEGTKVEMWRECDLKVFGQIAVESHVFELARDGGSFQTQFFLIYKETGIDCSSKNRKTQTA